MSIAYSVTGTGTPVLLLHGFPETRLMWRDLVPVLAAHHTVVTADLPGYGESTAEPGRSSKRAMAADLTGLMAELGFDRFAVAGHDRGGRVAYRMALDHPDRVRALAVLGARHAGSLPAGADRPPPRTGPPRTGRPRAGRWQTGGPSRPSA